MKHLIMGTAGHIDHGKTALVRALTGIECDTHREEQARGITINLGFAHLDLPSGGSVGVVDVPGHRDFVNTMVGGASGIDFALLLVAADSGVMPQTREHLQIMDVLGLRGGLVALNKVDLVEPDLVEMAVEEVEELVSGTFLEGCPVVRVSARTGEGLEELRGAIAGVVLRTEERAAGEVFRLFVDRIFTVKGFGTVVTGSVIGGMLRTGQTAYLLPAGRELRVRRLEKHGQETPAVRAGDRASINLVGLDREDFTRGAIISDRPLRSTGMLDARLRLFRESRDLGLWSRVTFHLGTCEGQARLHLIDGDRLSGGGTALVQVHLDSSCIAQYGDRFVIRNTSSDLTLGGGEVIDAMPLHHRRRPEKLIESMSRIADGRAPELVAAEIRKRFRPVAHREIAEVLNLSGAEVRAVVSGELPEDIVRYESGGDIYLLVRSEHDRLREACLGSIAAYHRRHPLEERGRTAEELLGILGLPREAACEAALGLMLEKLEAEGQVQRTGHTWARAGHRVEIGPALSASVEFVEGFLRGCGMRTPLMSELRREAGGRGLEERELKEILRYLVKNRRAYFIEDNYLHASAVDGCRQALLGELARLGGGMTVAQFRDLVRGNRRICLLMLAIYDSEGVTRREGDLRVLTGRGRELLKA